MDKNKNRIVVCLGLLVFMLLIPSLSTLNSTYFNNDTDTTLETSDTNYLFRDKDYTFNLDDFYDDANLYKTFTGAEFQTEWFNDTEMAWSGTYDNDTVTPVNNTETQLASPSGHYPATYSFEGEVGLIGLQIPYVDSYIATGSSYSEVIQTFQEHNEVLDMYCYDTTDYTSVFNYFTPISSGIIEFWFSISDASEVWAFKVNYLTTNLISGYFQHSGNNLRVYNETTITTIKSNLNINQWYHLKLDLDCTTDLFDVYLNNELLANDFHFYSISDYFDRMYLGGSGIYTEDAHLYVDGIGLSGDPEYTPSDHHAGTYSFTNDAVDSMPEGWTKSSPITAYVIDEYEGHSKVLYSNGTTAIWTNIIHPITEPEDFIIEFWVMLGQTTSRVEFYLTPSASGVQFTSNGWITTSKGTSLMTYTADTWYHIRLDFRSASFEYDVYINQELKKENEAWYYVVPPNNYNAQFNIHFRTLDARELWFDAYGESWDTDYTIGDNLHASTGNLYPDNINMFEGSYDYSDNMKVNDDLSTNFTSTYTDGYIYETPDQWDDFTFTEGSGDTIEDIETIDGDYSVIDSSEAVPVPDEFIDGTVFNKGSYSAGNLANTQTNDGNYYRVYSEEVFGTYYYDVDLNPDPVEGGRNFLVSAHMDALNADTQNLIMNGVIWKTGAHIDFDDEVYNGLTSIRWTTYDDDGDHYGYLYYFKIVEIEDPVPAELDVQIDMQITDPDLNSIEYFKFSHKTNVSVDIDLDIWNWDTTVWYEIESVDNSANFDDDSFTLGADSDYVNNTYGVRIRFQGTNAADFELLIDRFRLDYLNDPVDLEMTITFSFARYDEDLLAMNVTSWQKTNITQLTNFSIWNYDTSNYIQISSSSETTFTKKNYNTASPSDFMSPTGEVKLHWIGTNTTSNFNFSIDYLFIQIYYKLDLEHSKAFDINGIYRYRWEITGSIHYTQWVIFEVVNPEPNFHAISESDTTTRWILQNSTLTASEDFHDDINTDYWNLVDTSNPYFNYSLITTGDTRVTENAPTQNFGSVSFSYVQYHSITRHYTYLSYGFGSLDYFVLNESESYKIGLYAETTVNQFGNTMDCYNTTSFGEHSITWNTMPAGDTLLDTTSPSNGYQGWVYWDVPNLDNYYFIKYQDGTIAASTFYNKEWGSNKPIFIRENVSKNYFGDDYMYMQTGETELISLKSKDYGAHKTLNSGDYFEVDFQTSSDSEISLILLKDGVVNKTLTLSPSSNSDFSRHTVQIPLDESVEFDQLKISSTFEDTDYVKIYDIKTFKYTVVGDYADFYVGSKRDHKVYLTPDIYNLRISEEGDEKINENVTIPAIGVLQYIYTPIERLVCRIGLFNTMDESLEFTDYHIKVNRSLNGVYNEFWLLESIFSADKETYANISIYDRFNTLIDTFERFASDYIDLELEVYQLQIKNLMEQKTIVDVNGSYTYPLLSGDSLYFMLSDAYYQIGYYDTNDVYKQFTIYLDSNQAYELNRSKICFLSYADQQGNHLFFENYKTYLNGSLLYENMFYREIGDIVGIEIMDRYNISIVNDTHTVISGDNYIPITLTMYSLKVMSQQLVFNHINITRDSDYYESSMYWSEWIAPSEIIDFRLFAGYYTINVTNVEDATFTLYDYTLSGDDVILLSSDNTLYNVLYNIANVNTTIGNQITNVEINITNQNTAINNSVVSIIINIDSINSSLGTMLVDIDTAISNINTSIINEIVSMGTIITNINTSIINQILDIGVNITNMNSSIISQLLTLGVDISNINGSIIDQIVLLGVDVTNINTTLYNQILSIGVDITNLDTSITNQITSVISNITNVNTTILAQISSLSSDITNINSSIVSQIVSLGVDITNINTSLSNQILSLEVDITNINSSIIEQILLVIADIENIETVIDDQTLVILSDITNVNSTILNQMALLGLNITNINATIYNQILSLSVDLTNINASISSLLYYMDIDITSIGNNITTFYAFTNTSFINLNNIMNTSFIYMENNIIAINQTISNLVIGVDNSIYLINGTISTMITSLENNLLLMEVSINTALFNLNTTIDIIGANITSNYILLNNTLNIMDTNIDDSRIAMINNLLLVNNTMSTLIANVYSAVYLINNSIYTAVIDLGTYLSLMNNTIDGNLSFILSQNDFLTEIYQMTMFSELLNWTDIGLNTSLLTSQIDAWDFVNNYKNQSITVLLRYNDIIDNLTISAQNTIDQYLPESGVEYREWSEELQDYVGEWTPLPENRTVNFGFFETEVPIVPRPIEADVIMLLSGVVIIAVVVVVIAIAYGRSKKEVYETPEKVRNMYKKDKKKKKESFDQSGF